MKFRFAFSIIALSSILLFSACEKRPIDYRNKYTGNFEVEYSYYTWIMTQGITDSDTADYAANLSYDKKGEKKNLLIKFSNQELELTVEKNGKLSMCGHGVGEFQDENHFTIQYSSHTCENAGHGGGANFKLVGQRN